MLSRRFLFALCFAPMCGAGILHAQPTWEYLGGPLNDSGRVASVTTLCLDPWGHLHASTDSDGIARFDLTTKVWLPARTSPESGVTFSAIEPHPGGLLFAAARQRGLYVSRDTGASYEPFVTAPSEMGDCRALTVMDDGTILVGGTGWLYRSTDVGITWTRLSLGAGTQTLTLVHRPESGIVILSAYPGLYFSEDAGVKWRPIFQWFGPLPVTYIATGKSGTSYGVELQSGGPRFYRLGNNGSYWTETPYRYQYVRQLRALATTDEFIFIGRESGIDYSTNAGRTWADMGGAFSGRLVSVAFFAPSGVVYVGCGPRIPAINDWDRSGGVYVSNQDLTVRSKVPPVQLVPAEGTVLDPPPKLRWTDTSPLSGYRLQCSTDSLAASPFLDESELMKTEFLVSNLKAGMRVFWRVAGVYGEETGPWSPIRSFTVRTPVPPKAFSLYFPPDGADSVATGILFRWNQAPYGNTYSIDVALDSTMTTMVVEADNLPGTEYLWHPDPVARTYYWRVRSTNSDGAGPWTPVWRFTTAPYTGIPTLVTPKSGTTVSSNGVYLRWNAPHKWRSAISVVLSKDSSFTRPVTSQTSSPTDDSLAFTNLEPDVRYYWKARCLWTYGTASEFSDIWSFDTKPGVPMQPGLLFPPDGADSLFASLRFSWQSTMGAFTYTFEISDDSLLQSNVTQRTLLRDTYTILDQIPLYKTLYWRVRAHNSSGSGPWSPIWHCGTAPYSGRPILTDPPNGARTGSYSMWFRWQTPLTWTPSSNLEIYTDSALLHRKAYVHTSTRGNAGAKVYELEKNTKYYWRVQCEWSYNTYSAYSDTWSFTTTDVNDVDSKHDTDRPTHLAIIGNSPNPITSYTDVTYALPHQTRVTLRVHDALGRLVATLVDDTREAGTHQARFDAQGLPAGVYTARLDTPAGSTQCVMLLVR